MSVNLPSLLKKHDLPKTGSYDHMTKNEKRFELLITKISMNNNYEYLHANLIVHKTGIRELKNLIDGALEDFKEGNIDDTNSIMKAYNANRDAYNLWLHALSLYFVGTKKPTNADIRNVMSRYIQDGLEGKEPLSDDMEKYVRLSFHDYITGEAKTLDKAFKLKGTKKGYDHNDPNTLPNVNTYIWVRDMTELIIDEGKTMKQAYEKIQEDNVEEVSSAKGVKMVEPDKNSLVDNSFDSSLSEEQVDRIAHNYWKIRLPSKLKQDLWVKLGDNVVRQSQIKGMSASAEVIRGKGFK
jgi:hypothetical protein